MSQWVNQFSILVVAVPFAVLVAFLLRKKQRPAVRLLFALAVLALVVAFPLLFPGPGESDPQAVEALLGAAGKPVFLEIYSDY